MCTTGCDPESGPDLFLARSPRTWLAGVIEGNGWLQKDFAARIGVSASQLCNHFARERALSRAAEDRVITALDLCPVAADHYRLLVWWDRARSVAAMSDAELAVLGSRLKTRGHRVSGAVARELPALGALIVRELTTCTGVRGHPSSMAARLSPPLPSEIVANWVDLLLRVGLLEHAPQGRFRPLPPSATFDPEITREAVARLFRDARDLARYALDRVPYDQRHFGQAILGVPSSRLAELRAEVEALRCRVQARCDRAQQEGNPARRVYVLLLELFPVSRPVVHDPSRQVPFVPQRSGAPDEQVAPRAEGRERPRIVTYRDYRRFLSAWRVWEDLSFGDLELALSRRLRSGAPTRSQLHAIVHLRAHITLEHTDAWVDLLKLSPADAACLRAQVHAQQAGDPGEARAFWTEVEAWRQRAEQRPLPEHCMEVLGSWIPLVTLELANSRAFVGDPAWIAATLRPPVHEIDAAAALDVLLELGLLESTGNGALVRPTGLGLEVPDTVRVAAVRDLFGQITWLAERALDVEPPEAREMGIVVSAVPESVWDEVIADLEQTRERVQGRMDSLLAGSDEAPAEPLEQVVLWSSALFPVTSAAPAHGA